MALLLLIRFYLRLRSPKNYTHNVINSWSVDLYIGFDTQHPVSGPTGQPTLETVCVAQGTAKLEHSADVRHACMHWRYANSLHAWTGVQCLWTGIDCCVEWTMECVCMICPVLSRLNCMPIHLAWPSWYH